MGVKHHSVCEKCSTQTENLTTNPKLGEKNRGMGVKHHLVCVTNVRNKPKIRQQTQNSGKKSWDGRKASSCVCGMFETSPKLEKQNRGVGVKHHSVWNVRNIPKTGQQTQNSETKNRGVGVKHHGVWLECSKHTQNSTTNQKIGNKKSWGGRRASWCVWNVRNKPKTRQRILYAFRL